MISKACMFVNLNLSTLHMEEPDKCKETLVWRENRKRERGNQFMAVKEHKQMESGNNNNSTGTYIGVNYNQT